MSGRQYRFEIGAYTPETLPMARLAEYVADLAALLGSQEHVHFVRLDAGSSVIVHEVDDEAADAVEERAYLAARGHGTAEVIRAFDALKNRLGEDRASGILRDEAGAEIIAFPGGEALLSVELGHVDYGPVTQAGSIDGVLVRIGGSGDPAFATLEDGARRYSRIAVSRELAKKLRDYLYEGTVRIYGNGRWQRSHDGQWELERFTATHFDALDDAPLSEVIKRLQSVEGSGWKEVEDPIAELLRSREGDGEPD